MKLLARIKAFFLSFRVGLIRIHGRCKDDGRSASVVCAVGKKTGHYLADLLFEPGHQTETLGTTWLWNTVRYARKQAPDALLLFLELGGKKLRFFENDAIRIPIWIDGEISVPVPEQLTKRKTYREDWRLVRNNGFSYQISTERKDIEQFHRQIYQPFIDASHGDSAIIRSVDTLLEQCGEFELLQVKLDQETVAGIMISYQDSTPRLFVLGIRDGDQTLLKKGAIAACYMFALEYLEQAGHSKIHAGASRGFIRDGVLNYKRKYGHRLVEARPYYLVLKALQRTEATTAFLEQMPVVCERKGTLYSLAFGNQAFRKKLDTMEKLPAKLYYPGTAGLLFCHLNQAAETPAFDFEQLETPG